MKTEVCVYGEFAVPWKTPKENVFECNKNENCVLIEWVMLCCWCKMFSWELFFFFGGEEARGKSTKFKTCKKKSEMYGN